MERIYPTITDYNNTQKQGAVKSLFFFYLKNPPNCSYVLYKGKLQDLKRR